MAVSIVPFETIDGSTFYRNAPFDISFSVTGVAFSDVSFYFSNSTPGLAPSYTTGNRFRSTTGFPTIGAKGTLSVDVVMVDPAVVSTIGNSNDYFGVGGVAVDTSGFIYVANTNRHTIVQVDPSTGVGTVWAGFDGSAGDANGPRLSARFRFPTSVAWDSSQNLYVTDLYRLRKVDSNGTVSLLAGSTTQGYVDSSIGTNARFITPAYPFPLPNGDILLPNPDAHAIRRVSQAGNVTTYAGGTGAGFADGPLATAKFSYPRQMAMDSNGVMYIADDYNHRIRVFSNGQVSTYAGNGTTTFVSGSNRLSTGIPHPLGLAFTADGSMYISSFERNTILRLGGDRVTSFAGSNGVPGYTDGTPSNARFYGITMLVGQQSNIYTSEVFNGTVRKVAWRPEVRPIVPRIPANGIIVATSNYPITVNSRIDVSWTSVGGLLSLFKFEPFSNSITANQSGGRTTDTLTYTGTMPTSTELLGYMGGNGTSTVTFNGPNGASTAYTYPLTLAVQAISNAAVVDDVSTTVTIGTARIVYSPCNANLVFYRNEPSPAPVFSLVSSDVGVLYSATTLPTGLSFTRTGARSFALTGTPTVQTIASNYTILAFDTSSRTYSTQVSMVVNPERLLLDTEGSLTQSNIGFEAPIEPITFTARFPPYGVQRTMRYTWSPQPPVGIQFRDVCGTVISGSNYTVTDSNAFTLTLSGTITEQQLRNFAFQGSNVFTITVTGTRIAPTPALSPSLPKTITFRFAETIFFTSNVPSLFVGLDVSGYSYTPRTYFTGGTRAIQTVTVTDGFLPDGLDGSFDASSQSFIITGRPTAPTTYSFTLTAIDVSGVSASLPVNTTVLSDSVTVTSLTDTCFNFIQFRSLSNGKEGFYTPPLRYLVSSTSGCNAILTGTNLPAGVTLDASVNNTYVLSGRPSTVTGLTTATLTGSVAATGVTSTKTFQYSVSAEQFFFPRDPSDVSFNFIQNVPISPVQLDVSTFSENSVIRFSSPSLPSGLQVTNTGRVEGTPQGSNSGTFDVTAYTAYSSGTKTYSYTMTPDQVLLVPSTYRTVTAPGRSVSIPITGYSLSALTVSNYRFQSAFPYGLSINPTTGLLSGTLASSLPASTTFTLLGSAGITDGSLTGTMTTDNLTTRRAQVLEIQSQSNLRIAYSDDLGVNWSSAFSSNGLVAGRVGVNNAGTYIVPTSSDSVLRSTTGSSYTAIALGQSSKTPRMTAVVNKPGTSTWWIAGSLSNGTRSVSVFKSTDDGLTWDSGTIVSGVQDRSSNATPGVDAYLYGGVDLAYRDGVLLLGGLQIARSTDDGATWSIQPSPLIEVARFSLDQGTVWIAVGSSLYPSRTANTYSTDATTIVYSLDQGLTWTAAPTGFTMNAYEIVYGFGVWIATGLNWSGGSFRGSVAYSFDGLTWATLSAIPEVNYGASSLNAYPPGSMGAIGYDGTAWTVIRTPDDGTATLYSHPPSTPIDVGWTTTTVTGEFPGIGAASRFASYITQTVDPGADITTITFPTPTTGPVFVSPAQSTFVLWQYMPIPPITFSAPGATAYFVSALPVGLTWNSVTQTITGSCMRLGTQTFTVYAKNSGITAFTVTLIVDVPRVVRKQTSAGAYTALVRDYTEVNAAINARDTRVNPIEEAALGSFASPYAPDVVTPSNCPC